MEFDSYDPPQTERLLKAAAGRGVARARRAAVTEGISALVVLAGATVLALAAAPHHSHTTVLDAIMAVGLYLVCQRVEFPIGPAFTMPTQLAFVPMLLLLPIGLVPAVVIGCRLISLLSRWRPGAIVKQVPTRIADSAFTLGPVLVLVIAGERSFAWSHWPVYAAAMAAQILGDLLFGVCRLWIGERTPPNEWLPVLGWLYVIDVGLTCMALFVVASAQRHHGLVLLELPMVGLLYLFARERKQRMESSVELSTAYKGAAALLGDVLEDEDAYTGVHSREVADLSLAIALELELNPVQMFNVEYGALLHDVGKIRVPKSILQKPGKLTPEEWKIMREHTVAGEQMLSMVGGSLSSVGRIVRHSHERYDGTGYPDRLAGGDIPMESRIVSAADAWNAMTTSRPYRRALSVEVAADEMKRCAGTHFDPDVVIALLREVAPAYSVEVLGAAGGAATAEV
jgi:putative nucleotidyltransferase with HDIG domain